MKKYVHQSKTVFELTVNNTELFNVGNRTEQIRQFM